MNTDAKSRVIFLAACRRRSGPGLGRGAAAAIAVAVALMNPAHAIQRAKVSRDGAEVHQFPNPTSPRINELAKDTEVDVSSDMVRDVSGEYWYKVRLETGDMGYVRAREVKAQGLSELRKQLGVSTQAPPREAAESRSDWTVVLRGMGLGGYQSLKGEMILGGEGELSSCVLLGESGYERRRFSLGAAYVFDRELRVIAASAIYRAFSTGRWEPEARLRLGKETTNGYNVLGMNVGARYPLSISARAHLSLYAEAAGMFSITRGQRAIHYWAAAGLGFHL